MRVMCEEIHKGKNEKSLEKCSFLGCGKKKQTEQAQSDGIGTEFEGGHGTQ